MLVHHCIHFQLRSTDTLHNLKFSVRTKTYAKHFLVFLLVGSRKVVKDLPVKDSRPKTNRPSNWESLAEATSKKTIYMLSNEDIKKVLNVLSPEQQNYLWCLRDTLARSREINNLTWDDIDFETKTITLYTRSLSEYSLFCSNRGIGGKLSGAIYLIL